MVFFAAAALISCLASANTFFVEEPIVPEAISSESPELANVAELKELEARVSQAIRKALPALVAVDMKSRSPSKTAVICKPNCSGQIPFAIFRFCGSLSPVIILILPWRNRTQSSGVTEFSSSVIPSDTVQAAVRPLDWDVSFTWVNPSRSSPTA
jgi:hypothetical protein